ncbi:kinase-like domain-containing protein [Spinellus fusiger]|nr:kinase-like domain-containing protein [Spinellus fusiger]
MRSDSSPTIFNFMTMKTLNPISNDNDLDSSADSSACSHKFWARPRESPDSIKEYSHDTTMGYFYAKGEKELDVSQCSYSVAPLCVGGSGLKSSQQSPLQDSLQETFYDSLQNSLQSSLQDISHLLPKDSLQNSYSSLPSSHPSSHPSSGKGPVLVFECQESPHLISKRHQTKMLLVSLIESFCRIYGDTPDANRKVFFLICQTLSSLGIVDSEFVDEVSSARSSFHQAFQKLFYTAVQTVRKQEFWLEDHQRRITTPQWSDKENSGRDGRGGRERRPSGCLVDQDPFHFRPLGHQNTDISCSLESKSTYHSDLLHSLSIQNSRYRNDFIEVDILGRGGFASAWRARNKLDDIEYAVKKIRLGKELEEDGMDSYERIFRESKNLARLEHHNVVRYYSSWLEYAPADNSVLESEGASWDELSPNDRSSESSMSDSEDSVFHGQDPTFDEATPTFSPVQPSYEDMSRIEFAHESQGKTGVSETSLTHSMPDHCPDTVPDICPDVFSVSPKLFRKRSRLRKKSMSEDSRGEGWTLFIQMQLCPTTLHDYIRFRNKKHNDKSEPQDYSERNIEIFTQILEGAAYIHEQGLIHRDLKPSNIFLGMPTHGEHRRHHTRTNSSSYEHGFSYDSVLSAAGLRECMWEEAWVPKIGDFGLASAVVHEPRELQELQEDTVILSAPQSFAGQIEAGMTCSLNKTTVSASLNGNEVHPGSRKRPCLHRLRTSGVGTRTYASPEQLANPPRAYDEKTDIYSLGIIFFELYQPFTTAMERAETLDLLKRGIFPQGFVERYPKESAIILWMMDENPSHRPSATQLLEFELFAMSSSPGTVTGHFPCS